MSPTPARLLRAAVLLASAALALAAPATIAEAANNYVVKGSTPRPEVCNNHGTVTPGAWLANGPCGYVIGTALAGQTFDVNQTSQSGYHYGRIKGSAGTSFCAWIAPSTLDLSTKKSVADSCGNDTKTRNMNSRLIFGRDFDAAPHTGNGEIVVPIDPSACTGYYNYFTNSDFEGGQLRDPVGFPLEANGGYRYTSKDGQASMIRTVKNGENYWIFVPRSCIQSQLPANLNNQENPEAS